MTELVRELSRCGIEYKTDEPLCRHSSFKIGGAADIALFPTNQTELVSVIRLCGEFGVKYTLVGNGSNILFSDEGYRGAVVFTKRMTSFTLEEKEDVAYIKAACGASVARMAKFAAERGYSGLEFLCGIPATVGGAVCMNAGAYGSEMADILLNARIYDTQNKEIITLSSDELGLSYRHSCLTHDPSLVCLEAELRLCIGKADEIKERMEELKKKRRTSQPCEFASAGSFFKRPVGYFAAKLIDDAGLKGTRVGDAEISKKHAGFIVNLGNASAKDVLALSELVVNKVYEKYNVLLEREVRYIEE